MTQTKMTKKIQIEENTFVEEREQSIMTQTKMTKKIRLGENAFVEEREQFLVVDAKDQEEQIAKHGADDGGANYPRSDASQFSATEQDIIKKISQTAQQTWGALKKHFDGFHTRLVPIVSSWDPEALINSIQSVPILAKSQLTDILDRFNNGSAIVLPAWWNAEDEYESFRTKHKLTRGAKYLTRGAMAGWFILMIGVESVLNASLLWDLVGILTAVGQTILIAAVNVLFFAAAFGLLLRCKNGSSSATRSLAWLCAPVMMFVLAFNLGVGHYRDALVEAKAQGEQVASFDWDNLDADIGVVVDYTKQAMISMKEALFGVESVLSVFLILVGLGFFGFATYEWYSMYDPCPGYKKCDIARKEAHASYNKLVSDTRAEIDQSRVKANAKADDERTKIMNNRKNHEDLVTRARSFQGQYARWIEVLGKTQNHLLAEYRRSNEKARSDNAPNHFNQTVGIDQKLVEPPTFDAPEIRNDREVVDAVQDATDKINVIAEDVLEKFELVVQKGIQ